MTGYFLDWLSCYQDHGEGLPVIGSDLVVVHDLETGELKSETIHGYQHGGSWDSAVRIRCDGSRVEVSGNPSRWGRKDNLFGLHSVRAGVEVYNSILSAVGLPPFVEDERTTAAPRQWARSDGVIKAPDSVVITRVDITANLSVCDPWLAIRCLSGYVHQGAAGHLYPNGATVAWYGRGSKGSTRQAVKYYVKGVMLQAEAADIEKRRVGWRGGDDIEALLGSWDEHARHLRKLAEWCKDAGIIRHEVSLKSKKLGDLGLQRLGAWDGVEMGTVIESAKFHKRLNVEHQGFGDLVGMLEAEGVSSREARRLDLHFRAWLQGVNLKATLSKSAFYRVRSGLLKAGLDVSSVCDVGRLPLAPVRVGFRAVDPPAWYDRAA